MDAFAVSVCKGLSVTKVRLSESLKVGLWFGGFQALMPLAGFFAGVHFADFVASVDHWIAFILLGIIGANMIKDSREDDSCHIDSDFSVRAMLPLAVATSIDALAVGVSLAFLKVNIISAVVIIGLVTALFSVAGVNLGKILGCRFKSKAELLGGILMIAMGVRILIDHLVL